MMLENIEPRSSGAPDGFFSGPSCITTPVIPVEQMRIASSSGVSGSAELVLQCDNSPARIEHPRAMAGYDVR